MLVENINEVKQNIFSNEILFSNELIKNSFYKTFNVINSKGNLSKYHYKEIPIIILDISKDFNNKNNIEYCEEKMNILIKETGILPYTTYIYKQENVRNKDKNSVLESEIDYNNIYSLVKELNYIITNIFNNYNDIILLKSGRYKDYSFVLNMLFSINANNNIHYDSIRRKSDYVKTNKDSFLKNDINKIKKLLKSIKKA
jgi:hypothetical protein